MHAQNNKCSIPHKQYKCNTLLMPPSSEISDPFPLGGGLPPPCRLWKWESGSLFCLHPTVSRHGSPCVTMVTGTGSAWRVWRERGEGGKKKDGSTCSLPPATQGKSSQRTGDVLQLPVSGSIHAALSNVHLLPLPLAFTPALSTLHYSPSLLFLLLSLLSRVTKE